MRYTVTIQRPRHGLEEFDGGCTLNDARKEAAFFVANTPASVPVKICKVDAAGRLELVEAVRWGGAL